VKQIIFHFSVKGIGGVQNLYLNLMKELYRKGISTKLLYYNNTWLTQELDKAGVIYQLFDLETDNIALLNSFVKKDDIVITPYEFYIENLYKIQPYILYWVVVPKREKMAHQRFSEQLIDIAFRFLIKKMNDKRGFYFMDGSSSTTFFKYYKMHFQERYLPIPIEVPSYNFEPALTNLQTQLHEKVIPISYIGRAENWKVNPLKKIIVDLVAMSEKLNLKVVVHIVTDDIDEFAKLLAVQEYGRIEIKYHTNLFGQKLKDFLKSTIMINFAMGTSCLDSASLGVPSIQIDACYTEYPFNYKYRWLFENEGYSLGNFVDSNSITHGHELYQIFEAILKEEGNLASVSKRCFEYVQNNHDLKKITDDFLLAVNDCRNRWHLNTAYMVRMYSFKLLGWTGLYRRSILLK